MPDDVPGYRVLEQVGKGGFSAVYQARQERLDRVVALKVLNVGAVDDAAMRRFTRECRITGRLTGHPHVVTVLDTGMTRSGAPFIAMEYFEHGSLTDRLQREGPLPVPDVLRVGVKMASALAAVHEAGVLHRDVKPQNVLVSRYGEPALTDFGIALLTETLDASHTTAFTPQHAAPEVLNGKTQRPESDVYALGSTMYQLLAGGPAFQTEPGAGLAPLILRIVSEPPPTIPRPDLPAEVLDAVRQAMAKDPDDRFPTAIALATHLRELQLRLGFPVTELPLAETSAAAPPPVPGARPRRKPDGDVPGAAPDAPAQGAGAPQAGAAVGRSPAEPEPFTGPQPSGSEDPTSPASRLPGDAPPQRMSFPSPGSGTPPDTVPGPAAPPPSPGRFQIPGPDAAQDGLQGAAPDAPQGAAPIQDDDQSQGQGQPGGPGRFPGSEQEPAWGRDVGRSTAPGHDQGAPGDPWPGPGRGEALSPGQAHDLAPGRDPGQGASPGQVDAWGRTAGSGPGADPGRPPAGRDPFEPVTPWTPDGRSGPGTFGERPPPPGTGPGAFGAMPPGSGDGLGPGGSGPGHSLAGNGVYGGAVPHGTPGFGPGPAGDGAYGGPGPHGVPVQQGVPGRQGGPGAGAGAGAGAGSADFWNGPVPEPSGPGQDTPGPDGPGGAGSGRAGRTRRKGMLLASSLAVVATGVAVGLAGLLMAQEPDEPGPGPVQPTPPASGSPRPKSTGSSPNVAEAQIKLARPKAVRVKTVNHGRGVVIHWKLSRAARKIPVFVQKAPGSRRPLPLRNGTRTTTIGHLKPKTGYCFQVFTMAKAGSPPTLAKAKPVCIRGATPR